LVEKGRIGKDRDGHKKKNPFPPAWQTLRLGTSGTLHHNARRESHREKSTIDQSRERGCQFFNSSKKKIHDLTEVEKEPPKRKNTKKKGAVCFLSLKKGKAKA